MGHTKKINGIGSTVLLKCTNVFKTLTEWLVLLLIHMNQAAPNLTQQFVIWTRCMRFHHNMNGTNQLRRQKK